MFSKRKRYWVARIQYPGKCTMLFGNVFAETEMEAEGEIKKSLARCFPTLPNILALIPGSLFFTGED